MTTILNHPLVDHRMTLMRDQSTPPKLFRELVNEITEFLAFEALKNLKTKEIEVQTPVAKTMGKRIDEKIVLVPILRAGMGMLDAMLHVLPYAKVGVLGMQRNEETAEPIPYYAKVPPAKGDEFAIVIDPMFATGGSAMQRGTNIPVEAVNMIEGIITLLMSVKLLRLLSLRARGKKDISQDKKVLAAVNEVKEKSEGGSPA